MTTEATKLPCSECGADCACDHVHCDETRDLRARLASSERREWAMRTLVTAEIALLRAWARESRDGGWSTHQVDPMKRRADDLARALADDGRRDHG